MQARHIPTINARYWAAIALASVFGTNLGDLYAHDSGLGLIGGVPILVALFLLVYVAERFDRLGHEAYYWLCIIIMRTGATNIADFMAGRRGWAIDRWLLSVVLGLAMAGLAVWAARDDHRIKGPNAAKTVPDTDPRYWVTMLLAGVFGTVLGDALQHLFGQGQAAAGLAVVLALALVAYGSGVLTSVLGYWLVVAVARTAGTAIGDWGAESDILKLGLPLCTLLTGIAFAAVLLLWRSRRTTVQL